MKISRTVEDLGERRRLLSQVSMPSSGSVSDVGLIFRLIFANLKVDVANLTQPSTHGRLLKFLERSKRLLISWRTAANRAL